MPLRSLLPHDSTGLHYAVRIFLGTSLVWLVLLFVEDTTPVWAVISVIVVSEVQINSAWLAFLARIVNTLIGCGIGILCLLVLGPQNWVMPLGVTVAVLICTYAVRFPLAWRIGPITAALVMAASVTGHSRHSGLVLAVHRAGEVILGSSVALLVALVMYRVWRPGDERKS